MLYNEGRTSILSVESNASCGVSFPVDRETVRSPSFFLSRFSRGRAVSPAVRASHGNVMQITTGTRWARTGNASASRHARAAEAAPGRAAHVEPAARRDGFQDYYAVKSHLAAPRGGVREHVRSEVKSRGAMREGRACRGRTHAALGAGLPDVPRRGRAAGDVGPYHRSQPRSHPSHVPAPATFPPQPRSRRGFGGGAVRPVAESGGKRALCAGWVLCGGSPRRFPQGPEMFFPSRLLGSGGKTG